MKKEMLQKIDKWSKAELFENSKETVLKNEMEESKKRIFFLVLCVEGMLCTVGCG